MPQFLQFKLPTRPSAECQFTATFYLFIKIFLFLYVTALVGQEAHYGFPAWSQGWVFTTSDLSGDQLECRLFREPFVTLCILNCSCKASAPSSFPLNSSQFFQHFKFFSGQGSLPKFTSSHPNTFRFGRKGGGGMLGALTSLFSALPFLSTLLLLVPISSPHILFTWWKVLWVRNRLFHFIHLISIVIFSMLLLFFQCDVTSSPLPATGRSVAKKAFYSFFTRFFICECLHSKATT